MCGIQAAAAGGDGVGRHRRGWPGPRRGSARSGRSSSPRRTSRTRPAHPRRSSRNGCFVVAHGWLTLTTLAGWTTLPPASRGPITDSTAPTPSPVQNGRDPSTPSSCADGRAARAHLRQQAGLEPGVGRRFAGFDRRVGGRVDDALRAEVAPLVAVGSYPLAPAADGRLWKYCGSGLPLASVNSWPISAAADRLPVDRDDRPSALSCRPGSWRDRPDEQRVGEAGDHGEHQQRAQRGPVLANEVGEFHVRTSPGRIG